MDRRELLFEAPSFAMTPLFEPIVQCCTDSAAARMGCNLDGFLIPKVDVRQMSEHVLYLL